MRLRTLVPCVALFSSLPALAMAGAYDAAGATWTGVFIGVNAGYARGTSDWDFSGTGSGSSNRTVDGGLVGVQVGYNAQLASGLVAGVEVSAEASNVGGKNTCSGQSCKSSITTLSDISGRLGANWGSSLIFGKAGIAYRNMAYDISNTGAKDKSGDVGYLAGAGLEFRINDRVTSKVEYNYYQFGSGDGTVGTTHIKDDTSLSVVKAGFNLTFN